jgi:hypothetical protein
MVSSSSGSSCWSISGVTVYNGFGAACIAPLATRGSGISRTHSGLRNRSKTKGATYVCRIFFSAPLFQGDRNQYWIQEHFGMTFTATGIYHCVFIKVQVTSIAGFRRSLYRENAGINVSEVHDLRGWKRHVSPKRRQNTSHIHSAQRPKSRINTNTEPWRRITCRYSWKLG